MDGARLLADIFHDVDFSALRPADFADVVAQDPKGGPHPFPGGNLDARFEAPVSLGEESLRLEPRGRVFARYAIRSGEFFFPRGDEQAAIPNFSVRGAIGVVLEFVIAPAVAANIVGPLCLVGQRTVGTIELVAPNEPPVGGGRNGETELASPTRGNSHEGKRKSARNE